jgi:dihydrofolate reductase
MQPDASGKELALMVAIARNGAIGLKGDLPWSGDWPEDRAWFEETTRGHVLIMGKRTFMEAGAPFGLPSIVVSTTLSLPTPPPLGVTVVPTLDEALARAWALDPMPFVIGGVRIFEEAMPRVTRLYLTEIPESPEADVFFHLERQGFTVVEERTTPSGLRFITLQRSLLG